MKNFFSVCAIALVGLLLMNGCKKVPDKLVDSGSMTATVNGGTFTSANCYESFGLTGTEDFYIKAMSTDGTTYVVLRLRGSKLYVGDYYLDGTNSAWYVVNGEPFYSNGGSVSITSHTDGVTTSGTFNFTTLHGTDASGTFEAPFRIN